MNRSFLMELDGLRNAKLDSGRPREVQDVKRKVAPPGQIALDFGDELVTLPKPEVHRGTVLEFPRVERSERGISPKTAERLLLEQARKVRW